MYDAVAIACMRESDYNGRYKIFFIFIHIMLVALQKGDSTVGYKKRVTMQKQLASLERSEGWHSAKKEIRCWNCSADTFFFLFVGSTYW